MRKKKGALNVFRKKNEKVQKRMSSLEKREGAYAYGFIAPQYIGIICFVLIPTVTILVLCFTNWDMMSPIEFTGLANFKVILTSKRLWQSLGNTLLFLCGIIPITIALSLGLALLVDQKLTGLNVYKACYFLPMATSSVAITLVWFWIFAPNIGIINYVLSLAGIDGPVWLIDRIGSRWAIIIMSVWQNLGYYFLIFHAGLKSIPRDYYEAAKIDGANAVQRFFKITAPLLSPTLFFVVITMTINVCNLFQEPSVLTEGGPEYATYTIVMYIYDLAFRYFRMGEAAVVSLVLFVLLVIITIVQFKLSRKWVYSGEA